MPISRRSLVINAGLCSAAAWLPRSGLGAAYPDRPIRMVVPFNAGGNVDAVARLVGSRMSDSLGQQVIVDNRTGAGGSLGAGLVAHSAPDGYTLLAGSNGPLTVNPFVQAKLGYDPLKDFSPIALAGYVPHVILVNNDVPAKTVQELVALSRKRAVSAGTAGVGSATHLTLERFNTQAGARLEHVPYRGGSALIPDLVGATVDAALVEFSIALPLHRSGKARIIGLAATRRSALAPDLPTLAEQGITDFVAASYVGFLAPARTQPALIERLQKSINQSLGAASVVDKLHAAGVEVAPADQQTPAGFAAFLGAEFARSREAARHAGLRPE